MPILAQRRVEGESSRGNSTMTTLVGLLDRATALLESTGVPNARVDAELLIGHVLGVSRGEVHAQIAVNASVDLEAVNAVNALVERRSIREPLQHIVGNAPFRALELRVGPGVFVPRPETEIVAQIAIDALHASATPRPIAVDLGMGSGAIALAMATEVSRAIVYGVEVSPEAFIWSRENFALVDAPNATAVFGDLATALPALNGTVAVVISNPPYIPIGAIPRDPEVRLFDPAIALFGGVDGLDVVRTVSTTALRLLHPGGTLVLEHGELQAQSIAAVLRDDGWTVIAHHRDLLGRDRATTALR